MVLGCMFAQLDRRGPARGPNCEVTARASANRPICAAHRCDCAQTQRSSTAFAVPPTSSGRRRHCRRGRVDSAGAALSETPCRPRPAVGSLWRCRTRWSLRCRRARCPWGSRSRSRARSPLRLLGGCDAAYLDSWLQLLKNDRTAIFTAARHAGEAFEYILAREMPPLDSAPLRSSDE